MAVFVILVAVLGLSAIVNYQESMAKLHSIVDYLCANEGELPNDLSEINVDDFGQDFTIETFFQIRYFSIEIDEDGNIVAANVDNVAAIDEEEAEALALHVYEKNRLQGYMQSDDIYYVYQKTVLESGDTLVVFLDATSELESAQSYVQYALMFGGGCLIIFIVLVTIFSGRAVRPVIETMEKQKQFITNAGHELKTPVAIISANTEVLEMQQGESQATQNILHQTTRLTELIEDLIALARIGENPNIILKDVDCTAEVSEVSESFGAVAEQNGKRLNAEIAPNVHAMADEHGIHELVTILVDNAVKYCDEGGNIVIRLEARNRNRRMYLVVENTYADGEGMDFHRFFRRFYRGDDSHNSSKAGYGIGLSMAQSLVEAFKGKIYVDYKNGNIRFHVLI